MYHPLSCSHSLRSKRGPPTATNFLKEDAPSSAPSRVQHLHALKTSAPRQTETAGSDRLMQAAAVQSSRGTPRDCCSVHVIIVCADVILLALHAQLLDPRQHILQLLHNSNPSIAQTTGQTLDILPLQRRQLCAAAHMTSIGTWHDQSAVFLAACTVSLMAGINHAHAMHSQL